MRPFVRETLLRLLFCSRNFTAPIILFEKLYYAYYFVRETLLRYNINLLFFEIVMQWLENCLSWDCFGEESTFCK